MDNPKKPWKAVAAAVSAGLTSLLTFAADLPFGVVVGATVAVAALATYVVPNPKV
jgi:hypothetical protein